MKNISKKTSNLFKSVENISFGSIKLDKDLKMGLIVIILLLIFGLLIKNIISEIIQKVFTFFIIFTISILLTKNAVVSIIVSIILYFIIQSIMDSSFKMEKFKNEKDDEDEEDKKKKNENIDQEPITEKEIGDLDSATQSLEIDDISKATQGLEKLGKMLNGKIQLKDEDKEETKPLNIDFRNTKYSEDKDTPLSKAQKETYELLNTVKGLEDTIKTLSPVLKEGKRIMDIYQSLNMK